MPPQLFDIFFYFSEDIKTWETFSDQSWLYSILLNLIRDYVVWKNSNEKQNKKALICDTLKNFSDFWLPMSYLGKIQDFYGFIGLMGIISSVTAAIQLIDTSFYL